MNLSSSKTNIGRPNVNMDNDWFDDLVVDTIAQIRADQLQIETNTADKSKTEFYNTLKHGNYDDMMNWANVQAQRYFIQSLLITFLENLGGNFPNKLAFDHDNNKIYVWAEIKENDELVEDALIIAKAKANAAFSKFGFSVVSTIVEDSDKLSVPNHYKLIN